MIGKLWRRSPYARAWVVAFGLLAVWLVTWYRPVGLVAGLLILVLAWVRFYSGWYDAELRRVLPHCRGGISHLDRLQHFAYFAFPGLPPLVGVETAGEVMAVMALGLPFELLLINPLRQLLNESLPDLFPPVVGPLLRALVAGVCLVCIALVVQTKPDLPLAELLAGTGALIALVMIEHTFKLARWHATFARCLLAGLSVGESVRATRKVLWQTEEDVS